MNNVPSGSLEGTDDNGALAEAAIKGAQAEATGQRLYTLAEANQILRDQVCATNGHQLSVAVDDNTGNPVHAGCTICGRGGTITWETP